MQSLHSAVLSTLLVVLVAIIGLPAGHANGSSPAVISPLAQAPDSVVSWALSGAVAQESALIQTPLPGADPNPSGDPAMTWRVVSAGGMHSCGVRTGGALNCWGDNSFRQTDAPDGQFVAVSAGLVQSCAIRIDGKLVCWGAESARPKKTPAGSFKDVSAGDVHICAIRSDGTLKCWGNKNLGRLKAPQGQFASLNAGGAHTCALRNDGRLVCWGEKSFMAYKRPQGRFKAVTTGEAHACAIRDDDSVVCWGNDAYAEIQAPGGAFKSIAAGNFDTCGLRYDGTVECWGRDDFGETDAPAGENFKALSAGGAHACGIRSEGTLRCWGSNRSEMGGVDLPAAASPQGFPFSFLIQVSGFLGTGLVNYGKGIDQKWEKQESKNIRIQLALLGASLVLSAVQSFMPQPPDPVAESLKRIEADIAELKAAVARIEIELKQIKGKLDTLACNVSLQSLVNAGIKVKTAQEIYARRMDQAQIVLKAYAARAKDPKTEVPDVSQDIQKFVDGYEGPLREALNAIHEALVPAISSKTGPLEECMVKSFEQWKSAAKTPFDDRNYYEPIYEILGYALAYQNMALALLQDIDLWHAQQQLKAGKVDYSPGEMVGYCAIIREKAKAGGEKAAYWQQAQASCDDASELTRRTYFNMVAQIERAGAPYTGDDTVFSFGSKLIGKGSDWASQTWLWVRDVDAYGDTRGLFNASLQKPTSADRSKEFLYYDWEASGQAWRNAEDILYHLTTGNEQQDLPTVMRDQAGFKNVTDRVFWISGKTFDVSWNNLADWHSDNGGGWSRRVDDARTNGMKCFIASGIHPPSKGDKRVNGPVCNEWQMRNFTWRTTWQTYNGGANDVGNRSGDDNGYKQYENTLGNFYARWEYSSASSTGFDTIDTARWLGVQEAAAFFPNQDKDLHRWPVIDVAKLECTDSMVGKDLNGKPIQRRSTNNVGAPTRCGYDLDRVINQVIPRPDSVEARIKLSGDIKVRAVQEDHSRLTCHAPGEYEPDVADWINAKRGHYWDAKTLDGKQQVSRYSEPNEDQFVSLLSLLLHAEGQPILVRCSVDMEHGPTRTRYTVKSEWTQVQYY